MLPAPGTTLDNPMTVEQKPDLKSSLRDITEYFEEQGAYDIFDYLLKELLIKRPADPLQHMIDCLKTEHRSGPLKVILSSAPGLNRGHYAKRLAASMGIVRISTGDILKQDSGDGRSSPTDERSWEDGSQVAEQVMAKIAEASRESHGWLLDGFPRTRQQTCYLKAASIVPTHILVLTAPDDYIREKNQQMLDGELEGEGYPSEVLEQKLRAYRCHIGLALEPYRSKIQFLDATLPDADLWAKMEKLVRTLPCSSGPKLPSRVVILGPRGVSMRQHASRLAGILGAVFVDGSYVKETAVSDPARLSTWPAAVRDKDKEGQRDDAEEAAAFSATDFGAELATSSLQIPNLQNLANQDPLGVLGVRLRQSDCKRHGWVLCGSPETAAEAKLIGEDADLRPHRVVVLDASLPTCLERLRHRAVDPVEGKVWYERPESLDVRRRLQRSEKDQPDVVRMDYESYMARLPQILGALDAGNRCLHIASDGDAEAVFQEVVACVQRPLPLSTPSTN